jgi:hypothetical protein
MECVIECSQISYTNGNNSFNSCLCIEKYFWDSSAIGCRLDCSLLPNAIAVSASLNSCGCVAGYGWNGSACTR